MEKSSKAPGSSPDPKTKVLEKIGKLGFRSYGEWTRKHPKPSAEELAAMKRKIMKGELLTAKERVFVPYVLNDFRTTNRVIRALSTNSSADSQLAVLKLLEETMCNVRTLHGTDPLRLRPWARQMRSFPVLASPAPPSGRKIKEQLGRLEVGCDLENCDFSTRSKEDPFAHIAESIHDELTMIFSGLDLINISNWKAFRRFVCTHFVPKHLKAYPDYEGLLKLLSKADQRKKGRAKARIIDKIVARLKARLRV